MSHLFQAGGALLADSTLYVERKADHEALAHLRNMAYLLVIEPRQQGKTSLINHLMSHPALGDATLAYVDVTTPDRSTEATWYQTLCPRILRQLRSFIPRDQRPTLPQNSAGWRDFLWDVAAFATDAQRRVVIALDEIGAVRFPGATEFFSVLRDVYNSRQAESEFKQLTFLLAGAFHPRDLIKDDKISPFNIAQRVRLTDFTLDQVRELVGKGDWSGEQATALAKRIHHWTDGQPYLTQLLCFYLGADATPADVDASVERLRREDENHLPPLLEQLNSDEKLCKYVDRILDGECIKFYPRENRRQGRLELLGVLKANSEGLCQIRNRIYKLVLQNQATILERSPSITLSSPSRSEQPIPQRRWRSHHIRDNCPNVKVSFDLLLKWTEGAQDWAGIWLRRKKASREGYLIIFRRDKRVEIVLVRPGLEKRSIPPHTHTFPHTSQPMHCVVSAVGTQIRVELNGTEIMRSGAEQYTDAGSVFLEVRRAIATFSNIQVDPIRPEDVPTWGLDRKEPPMHAHDVPLPAAAMPSDLTNAIARRTLALFIGADLPRDVTGLPSRADLARDLARRKALDESLSLAEVAQRVGQAGNRWEFTDFIRNALDTTGKSPQPFHQRIVELAKAHQIETLITTAYDNLLELAFQEAGVGINRVVRGSDADFIHPDRPTLIKLYGDAQQPDTLVVTDRDHSNLLRDRDKEALVDEVRRAFHRNTVLFLGYNLADPDFRFLFDQVTESRFARTAYAVWPGLPETDLQTWRDRGIVILDVDPLRVLGESELSLSSPDRREPTISLPDPQPPTGGNSMDYKRGLAQLKACLEQRAPQSLAEFSTQEERFHRNERNERMFGSSENTRNERSQIMYALNELALEHCGLSFNDLCLGKGSKGDDAPTSSESLYGAGNRWAVLVGVNEYQDKAHYGQLHVCVKDVHAIHEKLVAGGFDPARIRLLTDDTSELPTRDNILVALKAVADATDSDDLLLFYYSGHGDEDEGESYLVARNGRQLVLRDTAVRVSRVKEIMEQAPARAKVIILDACHSGADIGGKGPQRMSAEFIRRVFEQAEGLAILASCKQGQVSYEWRENERSVFTHYLLQGLSGQADRDEKGLVTVQDAHRHVTDGVKLWASQRNRSQTPTLQYTVAGDIILVRHPS